MNKKERLIKDLSSMMTNIELREKYKISDYAIRKFKKQLNIPYTQKRRIKITKEITEALKSNLSIRQLKEKFNLTDYGIRVLRKDLGIIVNRGAKEKYKI